MSFTTLLMVVYDMIFHYLYGILLLKMKHISVIVPNGNSIVDTIIAPYNMLKMASSHFMRLNNLNENPYKIDLVGLSK